MDKLFTSYAQGQNDTLGGVSMNKNKKCKSRLTKQNDKMCRSVLLAYGNITKWQKPWICYVGQG